MVKAFIYGLKAIDDDAIRYIGKTINPSQRLKQHRLATTRNAELRKWIFRNAIEMIILETCDRYVWEEREKYWISYYGLGNLFNIHEGGDPFKPGHVYTRYKKNIFKKVLVIDNPDVLQVLIDARKEQCYTQKYMANALHLTTATINRYELNVREMPWWARQRYADILGYEIRLLKK